MPSLISIIAPCSTPAAPGRGAFVLLAVAVVAYGLFPALGKSRLHNLTEAQAVPTSPSWPAM